MEGEDLRGNKANTALPASPCGNAPAKRTGGQHKSDNAEERGGRNNRVNERKEDNVSNGKGLRATLKKGRMVQSFIRLIIEKSKAKKE